MPKGFLPNQDGALLGWARHFAATISISPETWGLSGAQSAEFASLTDDFAANLLLCEPGVRSKGTVAGKNGSRTSLKERARSLALIVKGQTQVTDAQRVELGLSPRMATASSIARPVDAPNVRVQSVRGSIVRVRLSDATVLRRGRPPSVAGAILFTFVGEQPPATRDGWNFFDTTSETTVEIAFPTSIAPGSKVWVQAAWLNPTLQRGPRSEPICTHLQFGAVAIGSDAKLITGWRRELSDAGAILRRTCRERPRICTNSHESTRMKN